MLNQIDSSESQNIEFTIRRITKSSIYYSFTYLHDKTMFVRAEFERKFLSTANDDKIAPPVRSCKLAFSTCNSAPIVRAYANTYEYT